MMIKLIIYRGERQISSTSPWIPQISFHDVTYHMNKYTCNGIETPMFNHLNYVDKMGCNT